MKRKMSTYVKMSFGAASKAKGVNKQHTTLWLIGGQDCDPLYPSKSVDLKIEGGALIKKALFVMGNITIGDFLIGDVCGNVFTDKIQEKNVTEGIGIVGDMIPGDPSSYNLGSLIDTWSNIYTDNINSTTVATDQIQTKSAPAIQVTSDMTITGDLLIQSLNGAAFNADLFTGVSIGDVIQWDGSQYIAGAVIVPSSIRYKHNINDITFEWVNDNFNRLNPVVYHVKEEYGNPNLPRYGLIAEEVVKIFPYCVSFEKDGTTPNGLMYDQLLAVTIKQVQYLTEELNKLKRMI